MDASRSILDMKVEASEEVTTPKKILLENGIKDKKIFILHISPPESEYSLDGITPDVCMLNDAPFENKLVPQSGANRNSSDNRKLEDLLSPDSLPEKVSRPILFENLSPRSVEYKFFNDNTLGFLRPVKVRRNSDQHLVSFRSSDSPDKENHKLFKSIKRIRSQSENLCDKNGM